ncbi:MULTISPECIES: hypothetical protein [Paenibacillus]|uniref:Uncharacterized protein n=1 Tax=Paenibacillus azoreducens TaxID=116718 RepID=A0A920CP98_9BACL|nr:MULTISPECIES: hypothetical protein [Paenibacillus]MBE9914887.1 hypothetical protein [Paenibacillus donghaensis]GIO46135.1 hypothetical protein J34TS1_09000 [Paenibacillus azoreducens]
MVWGAPFSAHTMKMPLPGSGEAGNNIIRDAQRAGVKTIAVDRYADLQKAWNTARQAASLLKVEEYDHEQ